MGLCFACMICAANAIAFPAHPEWVKFCRWTPPPSATGSVPTHSTAARASQGHAAASPHLRVAAARGGRSPAWLSRDRRPQAFRQTSRNSGRKARDPPVSSVIPLHVGCLGAGRPQHGSSSIRGGTRHGLESTVCQLSLDRRKYGDWIETECATSVRALSGRLGHSSGWRPQSAALSSPPNVTSKQKEPKKRKKCARNVKMRPQRSGIYGTRLE